MIRTTTVTAVVAFLASGCAQSGDDKGPITSADAVSSPTDDTGAIVGDTGIDVGTEPIVGPHGDLAAEDASGLIYGAGDFEGAGAALQWIDTDGDGDDELMALADQGSDLGMGPPYIGVWTELPVGTETFLDSAWTVNNDLGTSESRIRWMGVGDLSGDGQPDLIVERTLPDGGAEAVMLAGPVSSVRSLGQSEAQVVFESDGDALRWAAVPDVTGDGVEDLLAGDPLYTDLAEMGGRVWVFAGPLNGRREEDLAFATLSGSVLRESLGGAMAAQDVNGDGIGDVVLAASIEHVYVINGPIAGTADVQQTYDARWTYDPGDVEPTSVYTSPVWVGDASGDGHADVLFGSQDLRLVDGPLVGELDQENVLATFPGATDFSVGDANADGALDLLVGDGEYNPGVSADQGIAFLYYGPMAGSATASDASFNASVAQDRMGAAVALGDGDGDGFDDTAVGAPGSDAGGVEAGAVLIFQGGI